jgi:hypothetical protein
MQALKLRIHGTYWDSYLYDDRLFLVDRSGVVRRASWDQLVRQAVGDDFDPVLEHIGTRGQAWYGLAVQDFLQEPRFRDELASRVASLSQERFTITRRDISRLERFASGLGYFPTTDIECYGSVLYVGAADGLLATGLGSREFKLGRESRIYDGPALRVEAKYHRLAVAQGDAGLVEFPTLSAEDLGRFGDLGTDPQQISYERCDNCSWLSYDLLATTFGDGGYLGTFESSQVSDDSFDGGRRLIETVSSTDLFGVGGGTLVGGGHLLALLRGPIMLYETWNPFRRRDDPYSRWEVSRGERQDSDLRQGPEVLDAAFTVFGLVAEYENGISVYGSDGRRYWIPGEPVAWRVFPRSNRYLNQLHVIKDDWIDVYAFAHDYFLPADQRAPSLNRPRPFAW